VLPPQTNRVWEYLGRSSALAGFILIGGSALSLRIGHRLSEDLDFVFPARRLPRDRLTSLLWAALRDGFHFAPDDDEASLEEFACGGLELHDYQQDFLVDQVVRVSFFAADDGLTRVLGPSTDSTARLASVDEVFRAKCLVSAIRSKTRDWFDLYVLFRQRGYSVRDFADAFRTANAGTQIDVAWTRLCSGVPQRDDEGFQGLVEHPPSIEEMRDFFRRLRDEYEVTTAAERT
jgi:Nucleotidyl transferase AbiEii toxin, Type IV TA system